ncbi:MAG: bifunctional pyr operon transcriptional regulator/uracil phosphoribosyltransferase [Deltaproteobacteria bacterium]|nr:MAG: bifunctional pyr operon transcriptional regulator/uracil phosphoribosyltransferase [Deltaproteobacteria bacterium]
MPDDGLLLDAEHMQRALARLAHEIVERHREVGAVVLVGIRSRGVHLAHRLATKIAELTSQQLQVGSIDITAYRDDVEQPRERIEVTATDVPLPIDDRVVVLVDDVAALIDRGDREVPIKADFVGQNVGRGERRRVHVRVRELDGADEVRLQ